MIQKIDLGDTKDVLLVKFGTGDIMVHGIESEDIKFALGFTEHPARGIGEETQEYNNKTTDELNEMGLPVRVILEFTKPESVTVLIHSLIQLQTRMFKERYGV